MIYYMIRHKASGEFMPQAKKDRGYTNWNPKTNSKFHAALPVPRLIDTRRRAARIIKMWAAYPNAHMTFDYEGEADFKIKSDGRISDDLEVVEVNIEEVKHDS